MRSTNARIERGLGSKAGWIAAIGFASLMAVGCGGIMVNSRLVTQSGASVLCRVSPVQAGPNQMRLRLEVKPRCTTETLESLVLKEEGTVIARAPRESRVIIENETKEVDTASFDVQLAGTWLTSEVTVTCARGARETTGSDSCQVQ